MIEKTIETAWVAHSFHLFLKEGAGGGELSTRYLFLDIDRVEQFVLFLSFQICHSSCQQKFNNIYIYRMYQKNGAHLLRQIISKLLKLIARFWTCLKPRSFLFRRSRNSYFYSQ